MDLAVIAIVVAGLFAVIFMWWNERQISARFKATEGVAALGKWKLDKSAPVGVLTGPGTRPRLVVDNDRPA